MATYTELYDLRSDTSLLNRIAVATVIAAESLLTSSPTAVQAKWARGVVSSPDFASRQIVNLVLAANKAVAPAAILAASDAAIQSAVDSVVDGLIAGEG